MFLHRMKDLLLIYDMMIFISRNLSAFQIFFRFFRIFIKSSDFFLEWMVYFWQMIRWFYFSEIYQVSKFFPGFFPDFHQIFIFLHSKYGLLLIYDMIIFLYGNSSGFQNFFRDFPDFHQIFTLLHRMDGLYLIHDMKIFFSGNIFGFRNFFWILSNLPISSQNKCFTFQI